MVVVGTVLAVWSLTGAMQTLMWASIARTSGTRREVSSSVG